MRAGWVLLWVWLVLASSSSARPLEIRFSTLPPDCTVIDLQQPQRPPQQGVAWVESGDVSGELQFRLLKPGYQPLVVAIPATSLRASRGVLEWPPQPGGFLRLEPILVTATFVTAPPGAEIWTSQKGRSDDYLGRSGQPLLLNLAQLLGGAEGGAFRVRLTAPGYQTVEIPVPEHLFGEGRANRWPAEGEYALAPTGGLLAPLVFAFRVKPWFASGVALSALACLLLLAGLGLRAWATWRRALAIERRRAEPGTDLSGSRLGEYRLFERLGRGASATVFRAAREGERGEERAIKVFHLGSDATQRLAAEVQPLLDLRHPNLVTLLDWGQAQGFAYLVTELVPGRTLREELEHGPLSWSAWRALVDDLLSGLAYAHGRGVVHGDIKPENILLPHHGKAKLVDFGLARRTLSRGLQRFGGTPGYMAPELLDGAEITLASDLFSAGTVLYESLHGALPSSEGASDSRYRELDPVFARLRHPQAQQRCQDAEEARQALLSVRLSR